MTIILIVTITSPSWLEKKMNFGTDILLQLFSATFFLVKDARIKINGYHIHCYHYFPSSIWIKRTNFGIAILSQQILSIQFLSQLLLLSYFLRRRKWIDVFIPVWFSSSLDRFEFCHQGFLHRPSLSRLTASDSATFACLS